MRPGSLPSLRPAPSSGPGTGVVVSGLILASCLAPIWAARIGWHVWRTNRAVAAGNLPRAKASAHSALTAAMQGAALEKRARGAAWTAWASVARESARAAKREAGG